MFKLQSQFLRLLKIMDQKGVALIMVLWIMTILSTIVLEFCFTMRTEINITKNYRNDFMLYAMAEGGLERSILELIYKHDQKIQAIRRQKTKEEIVPAEREWITDDRAYFLRYSNGDCEMRVMNEGGKLNINQISESLLRKILSNLGLEDEQRDIIADSIMDWRDPDDFYRLNGAENDYYQSLKEPYNCKNGPLDSIEELLLVRGITREIFYGKRKVEKEGEETVEHVGLKDIFTIYSTSHQIDINSTNKIVLKYALGISDEISNLILKAREEKSFENHSDLLRRVPEIVPLWQDLGRFLIFKSLTPYYTIESKAKDKEGKTHSIKVVVKIDQNEKKGYKIIQWIDNL